MAFSLSRIIIAVCVTATSAVASKLAVSSIFIYQILFLLILSLEKLLLMNYNACLQGECASVCNDLRMDVLTLSMCRF